MTPNPWTPERVKLLRDYVAAGLSSAQIARRINAETRSRLTRNAVIGKVIRLGMTRPALTTASAPRPRAPAVTAPRVHNPLGTKHRQSKPNQAPCVFGNGKGLSAVRVGSTGARTYAAPEPAPLPAPKAELALLNQSSRKLTCIELSEQVCKFGTHEEAGQHLFCGHPVKSGSRYCADHHRASFTPTSSAKELTRALRRVA